MTSTYFLTAIPSLRRANRVSLSPEARALADVSTRATLRNKKEVGLFACGRERDGRITLDGGMIATSTRYGNHNFWFDTQNFPSVERSACREGSKMMAIVHSHPDGNAIPSRQDRVASLSSNLMGCVAGKDRLSCFYGDKDFIVD